MTATVLVVEDERKLRGFGCSYLERAGYTVLLTGSGAEAVAMAADASPLRTAPAETRWLHLAATATHRDSSAMSFDES